MRAGVVGSGCDRTFLSWVLRASWRSGGVGSECEEFPCVWTLILSWRRCLEGCGTLRNYSLAEEGHWRWALEAWSPTQLPCFVPGRGYSVTEQPASCFCHCASLPDAMFSQPGWTRSLSNCEPKHPFSPEVHFIEVLNRGQKASTFL